MSALDKIKESYTVVATFEINTATIGTLYDFCKANYKEQYANNERLVFFIDEHYNDSQHGNFLTQLQTSLNILNISNFFVIVVSTDENIEQNILAITETISFDSSPIAYFKDGEIHRPEQIKNHTYDKFKSMGLPNESFCVLPWISTEVSAVGTFRPCCLAEDEIVNDDGNEYQVTESSLSDVLDSDYMTSLRKEFLSGKKPATCRKCWNEEDSGRNSKRMNTLMRLQHYGISNVAWTEDRKPLRFLDLKLGNICNLKCRICGPFSSSSYASEELKTIPIEIRKDSVAYKFNELGSWPRKDITFWDDLNEHLTNLRYLEFTGGEPFMIREHFEFLRELVNRDLARNIEIHYNTNGTQWPEEHIDVWKEFKHVEIAFSIDNIGARFEYERTGANWDEVQHNIIRFSDLRDNVSNISLQLCTTINIYNVLYLHDIVNWEHFKDFDYVYWNMLHNAEPNNIKSLPTKAKSVVEQRLLETPCKYEIVQQEFKNIVAFMNSGAGAPYNELLNLINDLDSRRNVSLKDTHSELYEMIYEK